MYMNFGTLKNNECENEFSRILEKQGVLFEPREAGRVSRKNVRIDIFDVCNTPEGRAQGWRESLVF